MRILELERRSAEGLGIRLVVETTDVESHDALRRIDADRHPDVTTHGALALHEWTLLLDRIYRAARGRGGVPSSSV